MLKLIKNVSGSAYHLESVLDPEKQIIILTLKLLEHEWNLAFVWLSVEELSDSLSEIEGCNRAYLVILALWNVCYQKYLSLLFHSWNQELVECGILLVFICDEIVIDVEVWLPEDFICEGAEFIWYAIHYILLLFFQISTSLLITAFISVNSIKLQPIQIWEQHKIKTVYLNCNMAARLDELRGHRLIFTDLFNQLALHFESFHYVKLNGVLLGSIVDLVSEIDFIFLNEYCHS